MSRLHQLPRASLAWLLLALTAVVIPHVRHLPIWETAAIAGVLAWRVQLHRGVWFLPGRWTKLFLAVASVVGLRLHYGNLFALEPMVGLLVISVMLKLVEMFRPRDALIVVMLGFFVASTQFLFSQTFFDFLYGTFCFILLVATLISLNSGNSARGVNKTLPLAFKLTLQCLPVMIILFLFLPRFGNLWSVPLPQSSAKTGISDFMSPGDITNLSRDGGRAFTVTFEDQVPLQKDLYWRGLVLSYFDGRGWSPSAWGEYPLGTNIDWYDQKRDGWRDAGIAISDPINYEIIMESTNQRWLFTLPLADIKTTETGLTREFTVVSKVPISKKTRYDVSSSVVYQMDVASLSDLQLKRNLSLPDDVNPRTIAVAKQWAREANRSQEIINRFLNLIQQEFIYTLQPPALGEHSVDEFLWQTKQGFCEHFASAFVVFMRAAGIPSRVVTGYQGGEWIENFLQVSQADAHAWAEVWLEGKGWTRVDPTASVAPNRINSGIRSVFEQPVNNVLSLDAYRHINLLNQLRVRMDVWNYNWQRWVLNYDKSQQDSLLARIAGQIKWLSAGIVLIIGIASVLAVIGLYLWFANRPHRPSAEVVQFERLLKKCKVNGHKKMPGESARVFLQRLAKIYPSKRNQIDKILSLFESVSYAQREDLLPELKIAVDGFYLPK